MKDVPDNWVLERSSGYLGWRCTKCATWIYDGDDFECTCTKRPKETFEDLKEHVRKLNALLEDPQHGLSSWCAMYGEHMKAIHDYWAEN